MDKKEPLKISLSTFFLIIAIIVIIVMGFFMFKINNEKMEETKKASDLQTQVSTLNNEVTTLQDKINTISETVKTNNTIDNNSANSSKASKSVSNDDTISYEINKLSEGRVNVKATKNGKSTSKDFEMDAMIDKTGTIKIENIGEVALVSESGGEYCKTHIYQLVNNEIKKIGDIDCGADMIKDTTYKVNKKNEGTAVIEANLNGESIKKEFEMDAAIINTNVVDIFNYGKVVLVAETGGEYYGIQVYRLSQDYITGKNKEIKKVGTIESK